MNSSLLLGEVWESFYVHSYQVGVLQRNTLSIPDMPNVLMSTLQVILIIEGEITRYEHVYYFYDRFGFPSHSYLFDAGHGAPVHVRFENEQMICQVDEDIIVEKVPADVRPSYGYYPLVVTIPFTNGYRLPFTRVDDSSCSVEGPAQFVSHGWERVALREEFVSLWRVDEYANNRLTNQYWLDEARRIRQSKWLRAVSYWVPTKEKALSGLSPKWIDQMNKMLENSTKIDWSSEVISWLSGN